MSNIKHDTSDESTPVFSSWNTWYIIVLISNIVLVLTIYLYFKFI